MERPLEVVANTNPAIAPKGESPLARFYILGCRQVGKARDFDSRKNFGSLVGSSPTTPANIDFCTKSISNLSPKAPAPTKKYKSFVAKKLQETLPSYAFAPHEKSGETERVIMPEWWNGRHSGFKIHRVIVRVQVPLPAPYARVVEWQTRLT